MCAKVVRLKQGEIIAKPDASDVSAMAAVQASITQAEASVAQSNIELGMPADLEARLAFARKASFRPKPRMLHKKRVNAAKSGNRHRSIPVVAKSQMKVQQVNQDFTRNSCTFDGGSWSRTPTSVTSLRPSSAAGAQGAVHHGRHEYTQVEADVSKATSPKRKLACQLRSRSMPCLTSAFSRHGGRHCTVRSTVPKQRSRPRSVLKISIRVSCRR